MGWNGTQIKAFVNATAGKLEPLALAAEVFANINTSDLARSTVAGPPTTGNWEVGEIIIGPDDVMWLSVEAGSPGVWVSSTGSVYPTTTFVGKPAEPVADIAALKAVPAAEREDKQERLVEALGTDWRFDSSSTLVGDDVKVIAPTVGTGRWILVEEAVTFTSVTVVSKNGKTAAQGATGSFDKPYSTIAAGVAAGGLVLAMPGTYTETAPLTAMIDGTVLRSLGGAVTITAAAGKIGVIAASRSVTIDGNITITGVADSNTIELADGGGGAATTLTLKSGASVTGAGTGHAVAVLAKGTLVIDNANVYASGTGHGVNLAGATSNLSCNTAKSTVASGGGKAVNQAAGSTCVFYNGIPTNCAFNVAPTVYPATGFTKTVYVAKNGAAAAAGADGTPERPFLTVTAALAALTSGGTVMIAEGTYTEAASMSPATNTTLMALGGTVTITCATAVFTIAADRTLNVCGNISIVGPNNLNAVELADGATTRINLYRGASITSVGTGHAVAYAGRGIVLNNRGTIAAGATGNGLQMFDAAGSSYVGIHSVITAVGGVPINKPAQADLIFYGCTAPQGCTLAAGAGTVTVFEAPMIPAKATGAMPAATGVPAHTLHVNTDYPVAKWGKAAGALIKSDGAVWRNAADGTLVTAAERKTFLDDDFNGLVPIALYTDAEVVATGTAALQAGAAGDGELRLAIPAALDAVTHYYTQMSTNPARNPEIEFRGVTLSRITDIVAECGLRTAAGTDIVRFIFNTAVDGFWHYESTAVAGGTTNASTAVAPVAATPQNLRFVLTSATSVAFYIGDALVGTAAVPANIPAVLMTPYFRAIGLVAAINGTVDFGRVRMDLDA